MLPSLQLTVRAQNSQETFFATFFSCFHSQKLSVQNRSLETGVVRSLARSKASSFTTANSISKLVLKTRGFWNLEQVNWRTRRQITWYVCNCKDWSYKTRPRLNDSLTSHAPSNFQYWVWSGLNACACYALTSLVPRPRPLAREQGSGTLWANFGAFCCPEIRWHHHVKWKLPWQPNPQ